MMRKLVLAISCASLMVACSGLSNRHDQSLPQTAALQPVVVDPAKMQEGIVGDGTRELPVEIRPAVDKWLEYFQSKGRPHMERYLARSPLYIAKMKEILKENGVPEEMVYVAMIESGFSMSARSRAKAVGYWQFMRGTARRYGLSVRGLVDERRDPILSTKAAAQYLKGLYSLFGSWELALAAYNVGEGRVQHVIVSSFTRDYWEMLRRRMLPDETLNYVPKFIAAALIASNPEKYGFKDIDYAEPLKFEEITSTKTVNLRKLANALNIAYSDFKLYNPAFRGDYAPLNRDHEVVIRVPEGQKQAALDSLGKSSATGKFVATLDKGDHDYTYYRIRRGDNLGRIASRYGISVNELASLNNITPDTMLRAGTRLRVPGEGTMSDPSDLGPIPLGKRRARTGNGTRAISGERIHIVQKGETLYDIAKHYNVKLSRLARVNQISRKAKLYAGAKLYIPD